MHARRMGILRRCVCGLLLVVCAPVIGACSDDDPPGTTCRCEYSEGTCYEYSHSDCDCAYETCNSETGCMTVHGDKSESACSQADVIGSCFCDHDDLFIYYRSNFDDGFTTDPRENCENYYFDCVYTER